jgi:hypothetical protein
MAALLLMLPPPGASAAGTLSALGSAVDALPPSAAGRPALPPQTLPAPPPAPEAYLGGTRATGRVAEVYVRVAENVFLAAGRTPEHLRRGAERWVDIEFPELLADDTGAARAFLHRGAAEVQVGDVVEIKFAHKDNPRFFPVKERTRVTALVAKRNETLARDYARRILARSGPGAAPVPEWLARALPALPGDAAATSTAAAGR